MYTENYDENDFIVIQDVQKANTTISMSEEIQEGVIVQVKKKLGEMLVCAKENPEEPVRVKPFPPREDSSFMIQPGSGMTREGTEERMLDEEGEVVVSDVNQFLSEDRNSKSNSLE